MRYERGCNVEDSAQDIRDADRGFSPEPRERNGSHDPGGYGDQHQHREVEVHAAPELGVDDGAVVDEQAAEEADGDERHAEQDLLRFEDDEQGRGWGGALTVLRNKDNCN